MMLEAFLAAAELAPELFAAGETATAAEAAAAAAATAEAEAASLAASQAAAVSQAPNFAATASQYGAFGEPMTAEAAQGITSVPLPAEPLPPAGILDPSATLRGPVPYGPEADFQSFVQDVDTGGSAMPTSEVANKPENFSNLYDTATPQSYASPTTSGTSTENFSNLYDTAAPQPYASPTTPGTSPKSPLENGYDTAIKWAKTNPFETAGLAYMGASATGLLDQKGINPSAPYSGPLSNYHLASNFQGSHANPEDYQYTPRRYNNGGITQIPSYAKGSTVDSSYFTDMIDRRQTQAAPSSSHDVGIYHDNDPDTMYLDPLTAAMVRQSKLDSRSHVNTAAKFHQPVPMGTLNFKPVSAAHGGIMGADNLGSYASGGNPRLLKGPGDGMSDNIPATINNHQPARLADGEFVVPADVVSHLGNGSTEAGAKRLHHMMTEIRKARTGNPRQGKEINPNHFIPK